MTRKHIVIPDCQVKGGVDLSYLPWVGKYIAEQKPDVVINIGDFADMPSLSSYDKGTKSFEGRRYKADIEATKEAMSMLMKPIKDAQERLKKNKEKQWKPKMVLTLGNHEQRILRAVESDPKLDGTIGIEDLGYEDYGWEVSPYLEVVEVDGICYSHFFTTGVMGRPASSSRVLVQKKHQSCVMGHVQNWEMHREVRADGTPIIGMFVGCCYLHDEDYLGPQQNDYWRGIWVFNEVNNGDFQPMPVSLNFLRKKYGTD